MNYTVTLTEQQRHTASRALQAHAQILVAAASAGVADDEALHGALANLADIRKLLDYAKTSQEAIK